MQADDTVRIPLRARNGSVRAYAVVDCADAEWVNCWRWSLLGAYATRAETVDGRHRRIYLHRELLGLAYGDRRHEGDHIDRDTLNCRRSNLRVVTHASNMQNQTSYRGASSQFRGVSWHKSRRKWMARVMANGKLIHLGRFESEVEAAEAAREARSRLLPFAVD